METSVSEHGVFLVCEGACNPTFRQIEAWVEVEREKLEQCRDGDMLPMSGPVTEALRTLRYTRHTRVVSSRYLCEICGSVRRYGTDDLP